MKCRVCRRPAVIDVRRHNANFCGEHFLRLCRDQVAKAIKRHDMLQPDDTVLVAVSGGKDSLALWDILIELGYKVDGYYLGLGIGDYSDTSAGYATRFAAERGLKLITEDLRRDHGFDIPNGAKAARRAPCSACGLSKRHLFDEAARKGGYDVLATGHNLDDEAAVLMGNTLHWHTEYLGRQLPVLEARHGFGRKVKPLVRLTERDTAAYCLLRGIDYLVDECPMAHGNRHLMYKEALNDIEAPLAWRQARLLLRLSRQGLVTVPELRWQPARHACCVRVVRGANRCGGVRVLPVGAACHRPGAGASHQPARHEQSIVVGEPAGGPGRAVTGAPLAEGDTVLLIDRKQRRYMFDLVAGRSFHTHAGVMAHDDIIGAGEGELLRNSKGATFTVLRPTLADIVLKMPRGAQVIYPKDLGPILMRADIFAGARVLEAGVGSGALSMVLLRAGAEVIGYERRQDFCDRARANVERFCGPKTLERYHTEVRDVYDGIDETGLDRVVLDLPEPWQAVGPGSGCAATWGSAVRVHAKRDAGVATARSPRRVVVWPHRDGGGSSARLARVRRGGASQSPHGRPHRVSHHQPPAVRVTRNTERHR